MKYYLPSHFALAVLLLITPTVISFGRVPWASGQATQVSHYTCPMHPSVTARQPGRCPHCGMALTVAKPAADRPAVPQPPADAAETNGAPMKLEIPDLTVTDQHGRQLKFYSELIKGKTVAINFIFTTCTTICPPLAATFRKVQQELGAQAGQEIELISISVDPTTDVPERLKSFAAKFQAGPGWTLVTGEKTEIDRLLRALGAAVADKNDHTPMLLIGNDQAGTWTRTYGLAPAATVVQLIKEAARRTVAQAASTQPALPVASAGATAVDVPLPGQSAPRQPAAERRIERQVPLDNTQPAAAVSATPKPEAEPAASPGEAAAKYFPNLVLLNQANQPVRFYDDLLKGKVVLINFMFTACKGVCSPMTANLAKVQTYLGDRLGRDVHMISISVDPATDTPEVLKQYAASFKAKPGWHFLTGKKENVDWVLYKLGGYVAEREKHQSLVLIGNLTTGEWVKMFAMKPAAEIARAVTKLMAEGE